MNLYLITRTGHTWYDQYNGAVIAAESLVKAHEMGDKLIEDNGYGPEIYSFEVEFLGEAVEGIEEGYILTSFKAG